MDQEELVSPKSDHQLDVRGENKELLVMTVEIGDGRQDVIAIHENDDPSVLAKEFAEKHGLDSNLQQSLIGLIQENKEMIKKKELNLGEAASLDWMASGSMSPSQQYDKNNHKGPKQPKKGTVYDRIYQQLKKNNVSGSVQSTSELNKSKSSSNFNYGEYLYVRGLKKKEELKKNAELKQQAIADSELPELTFSPSINKNTSILSPRNEAKPEEHLLNKAKVYQEKLEKLKEKEEDLKFKECTFTPKINQSSLKSRESNLPIHEQLFVQAERLREKQLKKLEEEQKQYKFKPEIKLTKSTKNLKESKEEVFDRLDSTKKKLEEELDQKRKEIEEIDYDKRTGQKLFKPLINSSSEKRYNQNAVWDVLYSHKDTKKKELEDLKTQQQKQLEEASSSKKSCEGSDRIFHDFRMRQYERLFKLLDSDCDGSISATAVSLDQVDANALVLLTPFFQELQDTNAVVDFETFSQKMDILCKTLNVAQRSQLLKRENKIVENEPERKPFISQNSVILAEKKRSSLPADMYERLTAANKMTEMRMQKIKEEKEKEHSRECTFKPALKSN